MKRKTRYKYLGIDIGGTWIKGAVPGEDFFRKDMGGDLSIKKVKSPLRSDACPAELVN